MGLQGKQSSAAMPWSAKQNRLFRAAAHSPEIAKTHGMSQGDARKMASEGVKRKASEYAKALRK